MKIINIRFLVYLSAILLLSSTLISARDSKSGKISRKQRIEQLEKRLSELESRAVLSDPEFIIKKKVIWVCKNGHQHDSKLNGKCPFDNLLLKKSFTYQREKVFRRQTISEQIEAAQSGQASRGIMIGISGTTMFQTPFRLKGRNSDINGDFFGMGSMDIIFISKPALYTMFFADVEVIGGISPDDQIANISFLNSDGVRLALNKTLNLREGWMRTELFGQNLILVVGMLDLTNYFDSNTAANDETSQFITDALVNNLLLAPPTNGGGVTLILDPKTDIKLKLGFQRGRNVKRSLTEKVFTIFEIDYLFNFFGLLPEGHYRAWYRLEGTNKENMAWGLSVDQKLTPFITSFFRFGHELTSSKFAKNNFFYSGGLQFKTPWTFSIRDSWALGFVYSDIASGINFSNLATGGIKEYLAEAYYNLFLTENLKISFHLQYLIDSNVGTIKRSYLVPGIRTQFDF